MTTEFTNFVTVLRTGHLVQFDWAANALEEAGIPFQRRQETSSGLSLAMPVVPATGPGQWWSLLVPETHVDQAREILAALPIEQTTRPDYWSFQPTPAVKRAWQVYAWIVLATMLATGIVWALDTFEGHRAQLHSLPWH